MHEFVARCVERGLVVNATSCVAHGRYVPFLPMLTLVLVIVAHMMRMTRASVLAVMASPYIEMAILKGLTKTRIVIRHALPNALAPIISVIALNLPGVGSMGDTEEEALANFREAAKGVLESYTESGEKIPWKPSCGSDDIPAGATHKWIIVNV